jgi:hypothetical protein
VISGCSAISNNVAWSFASIANYLSVQTFPKVYLSASLARWVTFIY